jgi:NADH dehydrogenase FAD-containing subunit
VLRRLAKAGVKLVIRAVLTEIKPGEVTVTVGDEPQTFPADSVFFVGINAPNRELEDYLDGFRSEVYTVGDASGFHSITRAIHDGDAIGRQI